MSALEITGVADRMLSYVFDPLACGAAVVCSSWAAGLARLGKRVHAAHMPSDDRGFRLCYYLSIGAVLPRPGNATSGLLRHVLSHASSEVVCPFGLTKQELGAMGLANHDQGHQPVYLDPSQPLGIRLERLGMPSFCQDVVGKARESALVFAKVLSEDLDIGYGNSVKDGLIIGPYCVGLVWPSCTLVAFWLRDCMTIETDDIRCSWTDGVLETLRPLFPQDPDRDRAKGQHTAMLSRVSPTCLAVVSFPIFNPSDVAVRAVVSWTPVSGLRVARCTHDPLLPALKGWQIPPLDADRTRPVAVMM